jgi:sn-glycerol 3-phosphate transport system substrate-binding protein
MNKELTMIGSHGKTRAPKIATLLCLSIVCTASLTAQTEIQFWYAYTDRVQENNLNLTAKFNDTVGKEKGIHVTATYQGGYGELNQKLQAASIAGNAPEVSVIEIGSVGGFARSGVLAPMDEYAQKGKANLSDFQKGLMGDSYVDGKLYSLPYLCSTPILYMNVEVLKKAGLDLAGPKTWDEVAFYAKAIKDKTGLAGIEFASDIWLYESFLLAAGTSVLSDDELSCNVNSQAARDAVRFWKGLKDSGSAKIVASAEISKGIADIVGQKCGMWFQSTGALTTFMDTAKARGFSIATAYMPKLLRYSTPTGGCNLGIAGNKNDKKKRDAAWEFAQWMTATDQAAYASAYTGYLPSRVSAVESAQMKALYAAKPQFKVAVDQLAYATKRPINPAYTEASSVITGALDAAWVNGQDIDTLFPDVEKKVNAILKE